MMWHNMHVIAAAYPLVPTLDTRRQYLAYYRSLADVLPCRECRDHYRQYITSGPLRLTLATFRNRMTLFTWTVRLHDAVSRRVHGRIKHRRTVVQWYSYYDRLRALGKKKGH